MLRRLLLPLIAIATLAQAEVVAEGDLLPAAPDRAAEQGLARATPEPTPAPRARWSPFDAPVGDAPGDGEHRLPAELAAATSVVESPHRAPAAAASTTELPQRAPAAAAHSGEHKAPADSGASRTGASDEDMYAELLSGGLYANGSDRARSTRGGSAAPHQSAAASTSGAPAAPAAVGEGVARHGASSSSTAAPRSIHDVPQWAFETRGGSQEDREVKDSASRAKERSTLLVSEASSDARAVGKKADAQAEAEAAEERARRDAMQAFRQGAEDSKDSEGSNGRRSASRSAPAAAHGGPQEVSGSEKEVLSAINSAIKSKAEELANTPHKTGDSEPGDGQANAGSLLDKVQGSIRTEERAASPYTEEGVASSNHHREKHGATRHAAAETPTEFIGGVPVAPRAEADGDDVAPIRHGAVAHQDRRAAPRASHPVHDARQAPPSRPALAESRHEKPEGAAGAGREEAAAAGGAAHSSGGHGEEAGAALAPAAKDEQTEGADAAEESSNGHVAPDHAVSDAQSAAESASSGLAQDQKVQQAATRSEPASREREPSHGTGKSAGAEPLSTSHAPKPRHSAGNAAGAAPLLTSYAPPAATTSPSMRGTDDRAIKHDASSAIGGVATAGAGATSAAAGDHAAAEPTVAVLRGRGGPAAPRQQADDATVVTDAAATSSTLQPQAGSVAKVSPPKSKAAAPQTKVGAFMLFFSSRAEGSATTLYNWLANCPGQPVLALVVAVLSALCLLEGHHAWRALLSLAALLLACAGASFEAQARGLAAPQVFVAACAIAVAAALATEKGEQCAQVLCGALLGGLAAGSCRGLVQFLYVCTPVLALAWYAAGAIGGALWYTVWRRPLQACLAPLTGGFLFASSIASAAAAFGLPAPLPLPAHGTQWIAVATSMVGPGAALGHGTCVTLAAAFRERRPLAVLSLLGWVAVTAMAAMCGGAEDGHAAACACLLWAAVTAPSAWLQLSPGDPRDQATPRAGQNMLLGSSLLGSAYSGATYDRLPNPEAAAAQKLQMQGVHFGQRRGGLAERSALQGGH